MAKILVCGGRDFKDYSFVADVLEEYHTERGGIEMLIQGGAQGVDFLAQEWAYENNVPCLRVPAQWYKYKKAAGPIRNTKMLHLGQPDLVIAFPGGKGTKSMTLLAEGAGIKVVRYGEQK